MYSEDALAKENAKLAAVVAPVFSVAPGTYNADISVAISSATQGSTVHFTRDGSEPSASSPVYAGPIAVAGHGTVATIKALAVKAGMAASPIASGTYTINYDTLNPPGFSIPAGTYNADQSITLTSDSPGASIHYTTDGSDPTPSSSLYASPIAVAGHGTSITIKAIAVMAGKIDSSIAAATFTINYDAVNPPTLSIPGGTYDSDQTVTIASGDPGTTIYYTLDGSDPNTGDPAQVYGGAIPVAGHGTSITVKAVAAAPGKLDSSIAQATYTIVYNTVAVPVFDLDPGPVYENSTTVGISTATPSAVIHYTTDGSAPTASSPVYSSPLSLNGTTTLKAVAVRSGYLDSSTASATYNFKVAAVAFSKAAGTYGSDISVQLSTATTGATIHYTTDGSSPTAASAVYSSSLDLNATTTVKAIGVRSGYLDSAVATATYHFKTAAVSFGTAGGTKTQSFLLTLSSATTGSSIYYTTDGSTPTAASALYGAAFPIQETTTVKAIAVKSPYETSDVAAATYTFNDTYHITDLPDVQAEEPNMVTDQGHEFSYPPGNPLPVDTVMYYKTNLGNYGKLKVIASTASSIRFSFVTYDAGTSEILAQNVDLYCGLQNAIDLDTGFRYGSASYADFALDTNADGDLIFRIWDGDFYIVP